MEFGWGVDKFDPREAAKGRTLFNDRKSSSNNRLASYYGGKHSYYENGPS